MTTTSNFTPGEQAYIEKFIDHSSRVITSVTLLSELLADPQIDDTLWVSQVTTQTTIIKALYDEISQVTTPSTMVNIHSNYSYGVGIYKTAAETLEQGISSQNSAQIQYAVSFLNSGGTIISNSINMLNAFVASRS